MLGFLDNAYSANLEHSASIPSDGIHVVACGPIGTKFGTHMQIHLQMVVSKKNINQLRVTQGGFGGF